MRLTNKLIKDTVIEVVGDFALPIVEYIKDKKIFLNLL